VRRTCGAAVASRLAATACPTVAAVVRSLRRSDADAGLRQRRAAPMPALQAAAAAKMRARLLTLSGTAQHHPAPTRAVRDLGGQVSRDYPRTPPDVGE
jgi:hypothetical protein